jgi:hypothetical protein
MKSFMLKASMLSIATAVLIGTAGCSGGGGSDAAATATYSGGAVDGYLQGATVFVDSTANKTQDINEQTTTTDDNGDFNLTGSIAEGTRIFAYGGIDKSTDRPFEGRLSTIFNANETPVLSPLTTYVSALVEGGASVSEATAMVAANLGINAEDVNKDPMTLPSVYLASQKVQKTIEVIATAQGGDFNTAYEDVFASLASITNNEGDFNASALAEEVGVTDVDIVTFLTSYTEKIDEFGDANISVADLDDYGLLFDTYTEVVQNEIENNETISTAIESLDVNATVEEAATGTITDPLVEAYAQVQSALDNNISYLGANSADNNITNNLALTATDEAPFNTADLNLTWSTNNSAISSAGIVTRSDTVDVAVELKATVNNALATANKKFNLIVKRVEYAPVAADANLSINENAAATAVTLVYSDKNGDTVSVTAVSAPSDGSAAIVGSGVTYAPTANFSGTDAFTYTVTDSTGRSATANVNVTVNAVVETPVTLSFDSDMIHDGTVLYNQDFTVVRFTDTNVTFEEINPEATGPAESYEIVDGKLIIAGETTVELMENATDYIILKVNGELETAYTSETALLANTPTFSGDELAISDEASDDSADELARAGNELTALTTRVDGNNLVITVTANGSISDALNSEHPVNYTNVLWLSVNTYLEFGMTSLGAYLNKDIYLDGNFTMGTEVNASDYSYTLSGDTLTLSVPLALLNNQGLLLVEASTGTDLNNEFDSDIEVADEIIYDRATLRAKWSENFTFPAPVVSNPELVSILVGKTIYAIQVHEVGADADVSNDGLPYGHSMTFDAGTISSGSFYAGYSGGTDEWGPYGIDNNETDHSYEILENELRVTEQPDDFNAGGISVITYKGTASNNGIEVDIKYYNLTGELQETLTDVIYTTAADRDAALSALSVDENSTTIVITQEMLNGKVIYDSFDDVEYGNTIYGKMIVNTDNTVTRHEISLDGSGNTVDEWTMTFAYELIDGVLTIESGSKTFTLNSVTQTQWNLTDEGGNSIVWNISGVKPEGYPSSL